MSVILFFLVLFVLILVHEWGHFIVAKKTGMRVDEFAIGFPPRLFGIKKGETEYTFNALPIGGFVRIFGENPDTAQETLDQPRSFAARPKWAQALVLVAGVTMNVIFAWFLFVVTFMVGVPTMVDETVATSEAVLYVSGVLPESPLFEQLPPGSEITKISTAETVLTTLTPSAFGAYVQENSQQELTIDYTSSGEKKSVKVTPVAGLISEKPERLAIGVSSALVENIKQSFPEALVSASVATVSGLKNIAVGLFSLIADSVRGTADFSQVAGPIGIVGLVGDAASFGLTSLLTFTAIISLNLAVVNMLPVPALDGGRLVFVAIEAVTRRPINPVWTGRLNLVGFALLMILMVIVTWNDIAKILG
jgi:regulator of sigma E protease